MSVTAAAGMMIVFFLENSSYTVLTLLPLILYIPVLILKRLFPMKVYIYSVFTVYTALLLIRFYLDLWLPY